MFVIKLVQIVNQGKYAFVIRRFQQVPIQAFGFIPFAPLAKLATHE